MPQSPDVNPLLRDTATPPIPMARDWLAQYDGRHGDIVDLSQAVPGYPPHEELLSRLGAAAATRAAAEYGDIQGDEDLRQALAADIDRLYRARVSPGDLAITAGCNQAFYVAVTALARAGETVMLAAPWYFNHEMTLHMLGIATRALPARAEDGFVPDPARAEALLDDSVRAIVLVTPNNPTGAIYPPETLAAFADLCRRRGLWLIVDETYRDFLPDPSVPPHGLLADDEARTVTIHLYSFSKTYCVPGHRVGAMLMPAAAVPEVSKVLDCLQICAPRAAQTALAWAIGGTAGWREDNRRRILRRAGAFSRLIAGTPGWSVSSIGAYFAYVRHPLEADSMTVARRLAAERGILTLPGSFFGEGQDDHLRIAFANAGHDVIEGLAGRFGLDD